MTLLKDAILAWKSEIVFDDATTTVGDMPETAASKLTSSPATEFRAMDALEYSAANVMQSGYEKVSGEMGKTVSDEVSL